MVQYYVKPSLSDSTKAETIRVLVDAPVNSA
jgi:hypothetical protein